MPLAYFRTQCNSTPEHLSTAHCGKATRGAPGLKTPWPAEQVYTVQYAMLSSGSLNQQSFLKILLHNLSMLNSNKSGTETQVQLQLQLKALPQAITSKPYPLPGHHQTSHKRSVCPFCKEVFTAGKQHTFTSGHFPVVSI